jgi:hypothetical protein
MYLLPAILFGAIWTIGIYYYLQSPEVFEARSMFFYIINVPIVIWCVARYGRKFKQQ